MKSRLLISFQWRMKRKSSQEKKHVTSAKERKGSEQNLLFIYKNRQRLLIGCVHGRGAAFDLNHPGGIFVSLSCESSEAATHLPTSAWQAGATRQGRHSEKDFVAERFSEAPTRRTRNKIKIRLTMERKDGRVHKEYISVALVGVATYMHELSFYYNYSRTNLNIARTNW